MEKFELKDNSVLSYIPIQAQKPVYGLQFTHEDPTLVGLANVLVPDILKQDFTDFKYFYVEDGADLTAYSEPSDMESWLSDLFESTDNFRVVTLFNGLQFVKIPVNRFNDITVTPLVPKYGKYYIKVSPKYIETAITGTDIDPVPPIVGPYTQIFYIQKAPLTNSIWDFTDPVILQQINRLAGSIVEVWDSGLQFKKTTKMILEDNYYNLNDTSESSIVLTPNTYLKDSLDSIPAIGDVLRIYPRETYFTPIFIEVDYQNSGNDLLAAIKFLKNDATRDLISNVIEIYDDAGATVNNQGTIDGTVIQSYQITKVGNKELRKKINL